MLLHWSDSVNTAEQYVCGAGDDHLGQCASDDVMLDALLGTWHGASPERSNPGSNKQQQEARLAAWKARTDTATQQEFATGQANHDIIVLD